MTLRPFMRVLNEEPAMARVARMNGAPVVGYVAAQGISLRSAGVETSSMCRNAGAIFSS